MFESRTRTAILEELLSRVPDDTDKREGSVIFDALAPCAAELEALYAGADRVLKESFADTADIEFLKLRAKERGIVYRDAEKASVAASITLVQNGALEEGARFFIANTGVSYRWYGSMTEDAPPRYVLIAESSGSAANIESGALVYDGSDSVVASAVINGIITPGRDAETADEFRTRYFAEIEAAPFGGNAADYKERALSVSGVGGVKVIRAWNGPGTVKLAALDSDCGIPDVGIINDLQDLFDPIVNGAHTGNGIAPIGHTVTVAAAQGTNITFFAVLSIDFGENADAEEDAEDALKAYCRERAAEWLSAGRTTIRYGAVYATLMNVPGIFDVSDLTVNGGTSNIVFSGEAIPVFYGFDFDINAV